MPLSRSYVKREIKLMKSWCEKILQQLDSGKSLDDLTIKTLKLDIKSQLDCMIEAAQGLSSEIENLTVD